mgnify:CR=1 FL=1
MKRQTLSILGAIALAGATTACNQETNEIDPYDAEITLEDATFVSALEESSTEEDDGYDSGEGETPDPTNPCDLESISERVLNRYDTDQDGELSEDEQAAMQVAHGERPQRHQHQGRRMMRKHFFKHIRWIYDADDSGNLDDNEKDNLISDLHARCENKWDNFLSQFDHDQSGDLNETEKQQARQMRRETKAQKREDMLAEYDTNENGQLDPSEHKQMRKDRREEIESRGDAVRDTYIGDDEEMDETERAALRDMLREKIRNGWMPKPPRYRGHHHGQRDDNLAGHA